MAMRTLWSPVNEFVTLRDAMDRLVTDSFINPRSMFTTLGNTSALPANLYETDDSFIVQLALPGVDPDKVQVIIQGETLHLKGERTAPVMDHVQQIWSGIGYGPFEQTFSLPTAVEGDQTTASYEQGMLTLTMPKVQHARAHSVKVSLAGAGKQPALEGARDSK
jgi:HSP20 family protein